MQEFLTLVETSGIVNNYTTNREKVKWIPNFLPVEPSSIPLEMRDFILVIPHVDTCHCVTYLCFALLNETPAKSRGCLPTVLGAAAFECLCSFSDTLEVSLDLVFGGPKPRPVSVFVGVFQTTDSLPVFGPEVTISDVFILYSHGMRTYQTVSHIA